MQTVALHLVYNQYVCKVREFRFTCYLNPTKTCRLISFIPAQSPSLCAVGGGQTVNLTIIKHSENTTIADGSSDRVDEDCERLLIAEENLQGIFQKYKKE